MAYAFSYAFYPEKNQDIFNAYKKIGGEVFKVFQRYIKEYKS